MKKKLKYRGYKPEDTPKWVADLENKEKEDVELATIKIIISTKK